MIIRKIIGSQAPLAGSSRLSTILNGGTIEVLTNHYTAGDDSDTAVYAGHARHNTSLRPWKHQYDAELREDVKSELTASPLVDADGIDVSVKKGNVTLKGTGELCSFPIYFRATQRIGRHS